MRNRMRLRDTAKSSGWCNITVLPQIKQWMEKNRFLRCRSSEVGGVGAGRTGLFCLAINRTTLNPLEISTQWIWTRPWNICFYQDPNGSDASGAWLHFEKNNIHPVNILIKQKQYMLEWKIKLLSLTQFNPWPKKSCVLDKLLNLSKPNSLSAKREGAIKYLHYTVAMEIKSMNVYKAQYLTHVKCSNILFAVFHHYNILFLNYENVHNQSFSKGSSFA